MPEFVAQHVPPGLDEFTTGYLEAVEWLLPEQTDAGGAIIGPPPRDTLQGFAPAFLAEAEADCADFQEQHAADLERYVELTRRTMSGAGVDFWLTRNGHGAGFWDRGTDPVFERLTAAAKVYGGVDIEVAENLITTAWRDIPRAVA